MSDKSKIEWTDATWNPVTGCTPVSEGCAKCYASDLHGKRNKAYLAGKKMPAQYSTPFSTVRLHHDRITKPLHWRGHRNVFVNSMSDLFHDDVPDDFRDQVFAVMALCREHVFQVLTKREDNMLRYMRRLQAMVPHLSDDDERSLGGFRWDSGDPFPPFPLRNVIGMVTVENQAAADRRVAKLLQAPFAVRGISVEPMLGPADLGAYLDGSTRWSLATGATRLDWVICGGETGPGARPMDVAWARDLRDQCKAAGLPFFMKKASGGKLPPDDLMIRQYPEAAHANA